MCALAVCGCDNTPDIAADYPDELASPYLGSYTLDDSMYGTETHVTLSGDTRTIITNALPNHDHGEFPNSGNPNAISAQDNSYTFPATPTHTGAPTDAIVVGVGINGVPFAPGTAERVNCASGEQYKIVGLQDMVDLGIDTNNAHVQPTGLYHYHGAPTGLIDFADQNADLVHIGFARDGYLIYYSKSGAYTPSYRLSITPRSGSNCTMTGPNTPTVDIDETAPDGTYEEDWTLDHSVGNLDECNGATIAGQYVYMVTTEYPFVGRCLFGQFEESARPARARPPR